jgi:hypothetical protein
LAQVLGGLVIQPLVEMQTLEEEMASRDVSPPLCLELSDEERAGHPRGNFLVRGEAAFPESSRLCGVCGDV